VARDYQWEVGGSHVPNAIRPDRVAVYIRWSTEDQSEGTTLAVQQEACRHFVQSQGWSIRGDLEFVDEGYSGGTLRRPALTALRQAVKQGRVDCVVCFKLDRLSRSVVDTVNLVLEEWGERCFFKCARDPVDTTTPAGKMFFYLLASYAEWERNVIRERTAGGRLARARQGRWAVGVAPFGYRIGADRRLEIHEPEATVVRGIYDGYLKGRTVSDLVRRLQDDAAPAPSGPGAWSKPLVRRILSNPVYMGVVQFGEYRRNPRYGRDADAPRLLRLNEPTVRVEDAHAVIVEPGTYHAVQALKAERDRRQSKRSGRVYGSRWLLTGVLKCGKCGSSFTARGYRAKRRPVYYCLGRDLKLCCDCAPIAVEDLDHWFTQELKAIYADRLRRRRAVALLTAEREQRLAQIQASQQAVIDALADLERQRTVVRRRFRSDELSNGEYRGFLAEIEAEAERLRSQRQGLEAETARIQGQTDSQVLMAQLETVDILATLDPKYQKHLVFKLVQSLAVYRAPGGRELDTSVTWRI